MLQAIDLPPPARSLLKSHLNHFVHFCGQAWNASAKIYLEIEGWMEEKMGETEGSFQGGSIDVMPSEHARARREKMSKAQ